MQSVYATVAGWCGGKVVWWRALQDGEGGEGGGGGGVVEAWWQDSVYVP